MIYRWSSIIKNDSSTMEKQINKNVLYDTYVYRIGKYVD